MRSRVAHEPLTLHRILADAAGSDSEYDEEDDGPTASDIAHYARQILGLDPVWDTDLMWYACSILLGPLRAACRAF